MKMQPWRGKYLTIAQHPAPQVHAFEGAIGSAKTTFTLMQYARFVRKGPADAQHAIVGRTQDAAIDNLGSQLLAIYGPKHIQIRRGSGAAIVMFGRTVRVYGANNESSFTKIQGRNLYSAYVDEAVNIPESFFNMLHGRLRIPGAAMWLTCNPGGPEHWLLRKWLERCSLWIDIDGNVLTFDGPDRLRLHRYTLNMDDNAHNLPDWYIEEQKKAQTGVFYLRNILCQWVAAEGAIFRDFDKNAHVLPASRLPTMVAEIATGIDYGSSAEGNTRGIRVAVGPHPTDGGHALYVTGEWTPPQSADVGFVSSFLTWDGTFPNATKYIYVDPSAKSLRLALYAAKPRGYLAEGGADNERLPGIQTLMSLFALNRLFIVDTAGKLLSELPAYVWDPAMAAKGKDQPLRVNDHSIDALRYAVYSSRGLWRQYIPMVALPDPEPVADAA